MYTDNDDILYENLYPDALFKQMEDLKWNSAIYYIKSAPSEVSQWILKKSNKGDIVWRRLPIHEACIRQPTLEVIVAILNIDVDSARQVDNNGRLPLHHACIHGASTDVIYQLLHVYHDAIDVKDIWGKTPKDCALSSFHMNKDDIIEALTQKSPEEINMLASEKVKSLQDDSSENEKKEAESKDSEDKCAKSVIQAVEAELAQAQIDSASTIKQANEEKEEILARERKLGEKIIELEDQLERQAIAARDEQVNLKDEYDSIMKRNSDMKFGFDKLETQVKSLEEVIESKNKFIKELKEKVEHSNIDLQEKLEKSANDTKTFVDNLMDDKLKLQKALSNLTTKFRQFEDNIVDHIEGRIGEVKKESENKFAEKNQVLKETVEKLKELQEENTTLKEDNFGMTKMIKELKEEATRTIEKNQHKVMEIFDKISAMDGDESQSEKITHLEGKMLYTEEKLKKLRIENKNLLDYQSQAEERMDAMEEVIADLERQIEIG
eukprot:CAMPEP_0184864694 /NCGR_PEP_ID=MMETSP0580-20130426/15850_1 /TAXON_ID=1118495 /ORGANISM="Dactyliosolen fragilissimus" /LENGTH=494 /DNA_ID=CAMNT_0027363597 /DNA_START=15 /DNA_END=1499 /DNA_ORIENTATION=-